MPQSPAISVLIIEDDRVLQDLYLDSFSGAGFKVIQAFDGAEGLALLEGNPDVKVILADIMLPKLSGYDVIARLRKQALYKDIPVIVVSALGEQEDRERGIKAGATQYVGKGELSPNQLVEQVRRYAGA